MARAARQLGEASGGALDVSVMPLLRLWGFAAGSQPLVSPPDDASIQAALAVTGPHAPCDAAAYDLHGDGLPRQQLVRYTPQP